MKLSRAFVTGSIVVALLASGASAQSKSGRQGSRSAPATPNRSGGGPDL
jgi:hypothetical protein